MALKDGIGRMKIVGKAGWLCNGNAMVKTVKEDDKGEEGSSSEREESSREVGRFTSADRRHLERCSHWILGLSLSV